MNIPLRPNFAVIYRWRLKPGMEQQFIENWSHGTQVLLEHGSFGSRLHKGPDNIWYAYAQWPDAETRERAFALTADTPDDRKMQDAVEESFPALILEPVADYLLLPG
ncbi:MAG TPA: hypothetical protein VK832_18025 [Burkholderiaceae bacterium]|jgi:hypothetical protein|nr:hypothetical protein [Burkholderiaceae bacterium]